VRECGVSIDMELEWKGWPAQGLQQHSRMGGLVHHVQSVHETEATKQLVELAGPNVPLRIHAVELDIDERLATGWVSKREGLWLSEECSTALSPRERVRDDPTTLALRVITVR
jgi:hypothetical protein